MGYESRCSTIVGRDRRRMSANSSAFTRRGRSLDFLRRHGHAPPGRSKIMRRAGTPQCPRRQTCRWLSNLTRPRLARSARKAAAPGLPQLATPREGHGPGITGQTLVAGGALVADTRAVMALALRARRPAADL